MTSRPENGGPGGAAEIAVHRSFDGLGCLLDGGAVAQVHLEHPVDENVGGPDVEGGDPCAQLDQDRRGRGAHS
jgi:hypothetical protein